MKNKRGIWIVVIIIAALFAIGIWILTSPSVDNQVNQDSEDTIEGVMLD